MDLKKYRTKHAKLSREKMGDLVGVTGITVWRWETGRSTPSPDDMRRVLDATGGKVTPNDFVKREEA